MEKLCRVFSLAASGLHTTELTEPFNQPERKAQKPDCQLVLQDIKDGSKLTKTAVRL